MSNIGGIVINHDKTRKTIRHIENSREVGVKLREKSGTVLVIHFKHIFEEGELQEEAVVRKFRTTTQHGAVEDLTQTQEAPRHTLSQYG